MMNLGITGDWAVINDCRDYITGYIGTMGMVSNFGNCGVCTGNIGIIWGYLGWPLKLFEKY